MRCAVTYDLFLYFFSFNDTATTDIYSLSLHDALPILSSFLSLSHAVFKKMNRKRTGANINIFMIDDFDNLKVVFKFLKRDRKSTRLNSSHVAISYAVFCLKKKRKKIMTSMT